MRKIPLSSHDFGKDMLPQIINKYRVFAYNFRDENKKETSYWRDVGTIDAYYEANMDLVSVSPDFQLYDKSWPLHTWQQQYPPAKFVFADPDRMGVALDSIVGSGLDCFRRTREKLGAGLRRAGQQLLRREESIIFNHVNIGRQFADSQGHHRPACESARGHRDRLRRWRRIAARYQVTDERHGGRGARRIDDEEPE